MKVLAEHIEWYISQIKDTASGKCCQSISKCLNDRYICLKLLNTMYMDALCANECRIFVALVMPFSRWHKDAGMWNFGMKCLILSGALGYYYRTIVYMCSWSSRISRNNKAYANW